MMMMNQNENEQSDHEQRIPEFYRFYRSISSDNLLTSYQRVRSISESFVSITENPAFNPNLFLSTEIFIPLILYQRLIQRCQNLMKIRGYSTLMEAGERLFLPFDNDIEQQWHKTLDYYYDERHCYDHNRIENEICQIFNALMNDEREIMLGLDSLASLKDLLITAMRICSEPNFKLEIRIGLGGTHDDLTLRTPSYAIAGIYLLERLLQLREQFSSIASTNSESIPTVMLRHPPVLRFFVAWRAGVEVNNLNATIGRENACKMLSYIRKYINQYHQNLIDYIQYEVDHRNTYEEKLLNTIRYHFIHNYNDQQIKNELIRGAKKRGSNEEGSIKYTSMHLIIFKDIIEKNSTNSLFYLLDEHNNEIEQDACLYDSVITIGGSVEIRFNEVRHSVRQSFINHLKNNNTYEEKFHFPLSIRMLSESGHTPVYYHYKKDDIKYEITVKQILENNFNDLKLTDQNYKGIRKDLIILMEDIGRSQLTSIFNQIPNLHFYRMYLWKDMITTLIDLCLRVWKEHATDNINRKCQCSIDGNQQTIDQICRHYNLENHMNDDTRLILEKISNRLTNKIGVRPGDKNLRRNRLDTCINKSTPNQMVNELNSVLTNILFNFIRTNISLY